MAGTLTEKDVRNIPKCPRHENCCSIKTGTTENETYGKSFFICNNRIKEHCTFSKPAENIQETKCPLHQQMVELKSFAMKADGLRCYYRCIQGKQNNSSWCGSVRLGVKKSGKLKDITNRQDLPSRDNPLKTKREIDISSKNEVPVETVETIVNGLFHIPHSSGSTSSMVNTSDKDHENPEKVSDQQNKKLNFVVVGESDGCTDGVYDMSKTSFHVPRNARISDISETSSHNSSTSSASAIGESELVNEATGYAPSSDTIEIVSSAEEGEEEEEERGGGEGGGEGGGAKKSDFVDTKIHNNSRNSHGLDVQTLEIQISKQKGLLQRIGPITNDNGEKLKKDIERLTKQLEHAKLEQKKPALVKPNVQPLNLVDHFKSMARVRQDLPSMSSGHKHAINLGYDIPSHTVHDNLAMGSKQLPMFGGRMTDKRLKEVVRMSKEAIEHLHKSLDTCPTSTEESEDPKHLKVNLMTHQRQALAWLLWRETQTPSCGILADDMGLGKTLTMISLTLKSKQQDLSRIKEAPKDKGLLFTNSTLIVCPASLIHQWYKEIENRVEKMQLRVCLYHGSNRETRVKKLAGYDIILTTYNIVSIEGKPFIQQQKEKPSKPALSEWIDSSGPAKTECGPVFKLFYRRIILDEGHTIKNYKTNISIGVCSLEAESRWIVTGTPIQNQTMDLYSLIKFLRVSPFDELKFWKHEVDNKTASGRKRMTSIVNSLLLRRTKDQIDAKTGKPLVTLPKRSSVLHKLQLSKSETDVYELVQSFSKNMFTQFLDTRKDASGHSTKEAPKSGDYKMPGEVLGMKVEHALTTLGLRSVNADSASCLLVLVLRLRQCCSHMSLMREALDTDLCKSEGIDVPLDEQLGNLSIDERNVDSQNFRPKELKTTFQSTKVKTLLEKLKELQLESEGKKPIKSVIVSQWTRMLDIIAYHLKHDGFKFDFITGSISAKKRSDIVEKFNSDGDPQVMLVSLKAGGVGLNLIGGSHLFLIDQHWNPSLEDQACDRIYRLGQQNDVVIHRFLCLNTVEERIVQLQEKKKALANSVLYGGKSQKLSLDDLKTIFGITR